MYGSADAEISDRLEPHGRFGDVEWERANCVLCGASSNRVVMEAGDLLYGCPGTFHLVRCRECGHRYLDPRPTCETIGRFYPEGYGPHLDVQPTAASVDSPTADAPQRAPWYLSRPVRCIPGLRHLYYWLSESYAEIVPRVSGDTPRGLEIGCGNGRFLELLQERGWEVEGIEPAEVPARRCRDRGLNVHEGDFHSASLPVGVFDGVFAWMVLEHLHDPAKALRKMHRLLKPDGTLVMSVPNVGCWEPKLFGRFWYSLQLPTHLQHFTPRTLQRLLRQNGFEVSRLYHQQNVNNVIGSIGIWLRDRFPGNRLGPRLIHFTDSPSMWGRLALAPLAKLLSAFRQGGRLTVVAQPKAGRTHEPVTTQDSEATS